jgi:phosphatidylinositol-3-phosphatase
MTLPTLPAGLRPLLAAAALAAAPPLTAALPATPPSHIVVVVEENHGYADIIGNSAAPYLNALARGGALMTRSYATTHPSEPNYLELFSGSAQGVTDDSCPNSFTAPNLGGQLLAAGKTFAGYSEDLPSVGYTGCTSGKYARKHNPWVMFTDIPATANQPFSTFPQGHFQDLPAVAFVIPNLDNDMHDGTIQAADTWLRTNLDSYVQWAKANNSLLVVTFDEDDSGGGNQIATLFCGPMVKPGQYGETINHDNVLRTLEDLHGLGHAGRAATAAAIADIWTEPGPPRAPVNGLQLVPAANP